jgi:hypothetical protein
MLVQQQRATLRKLEQCFFNDQAKIRRLKKLAYTMISRPDYGDSKHPCNVGEIASEYSFDSIYVNMSQ